MQVDKCERLWITKIAKIGAPIYIECMATKTKRELAEKHIRIYPSTYEMLEAEATERGVSIAWLLKEKLQ